MRFPQINCQTSLGGLQPGYHILGGPSLSDILDFFQNSEPSLRGVPMEELHLTYPIDAEFSNSSFMVCRGASYPEAVASRERYQGKRPECLTLNFGEADAPTTLQSLVVACWKFYPGVPYHELRVVRLHGYTACSGILQVIPNGAISNENHPRTEGGLTHTKV